MAPLARAADWQQPTAEELAMTAEPMAPNADAICLYREVAVDNQEGTGTLYVRLKILRGEGKRYGDVEIEFGGVAADVTGIQGRTIHSDGTVIPFTGKPYEKLLIKSSSVKYRAKVFSLPDVQVGSILEYRYKLHYNDDYVISPNWLLQMPLFIRKAHYRYTPLGQRYTVGMDNSSAFRAVAYTERLPPGARVVQKDGSYLLDLVNVPALPAEEYAPPMEALGYHLRFNYTSNGSREEFWSDYGKRWSQTIDNFAASSPALTTAARELTEGATTDDQKLQRLYAAVMKLDNTTYSREHSQQENRVQGVRHIKSAKDIWTLKRGTDDDIAMLFLSLARAAGVHAYGMQLVSRQRGFFDQNYLTGDQLDDLLVIAMVDGKERIFDPGERYVAYGELGWQHHMAGGLRQKEGGATEIVVTPKAGYKESTTERSADLKIAADGTISGDATIVYTGARALHWRQKVLEGDVQSLKQEFDDGLQAELPPGAIVHVHHFLGLDTPESGLMARLEVSGNIGTSTGKRLVLPLSLFVGASHPFSSSLREAPVDLHFPYMERDEIVLHLPEGMQMESTPEPARVSLPGMAMYVANTRSDSSSITFTRSLVMANDLYRPSEYGKLKGFLDEVSTRDHQQAVLQTAAPKGTQ